MHEIDNMYDWWRLGNLLLGLLCFPWLIGAIVKQRHEWNTKTRDFWYSRMMWAIVQCLISVEGIVFHRHFTVSIMFVTLAGVVTFLGLVRKGSWGYVAPDVQRTV